jgi:hypothetical protein
MNKLCRLLAEIMFRIIPSRPMAQSPELSGVALWLLLALGAMNITQLHDRAMVDWN